MLRKRISTAAQILLDDHNHPWPLFYFPSVTPLAFKMCNAVFLMLLSSWDQSACLTSLQVCDMISDATLIGYWPQYRVNVHTEWRLHDQSNNISLPPWNSRSDLNFVIIKNWAPRDTVTRRDSETPVTSNASLVLLNWIILTQLYVHLIMRFTPRSRYLNNQKLKA